MLNAFRHQRFNTPQRDFPLNLSLCAQRLSASEIQHVAQIVTLSITNTVLNAFRHQRFDTALVGERGAELVSAQRLSASEIRHSSGIFCDTTITSCSTPFGIRDSTQAVTTIYGRSLLCSTPFGIRDSTPIAVALASLVVSVLNAFRHQRFDTSSHWT